MNAPRLGWRCRWLRLVTVIGCASFMAVAFSPVLRAQGTGLVTGVVSDAVTGKFLEGVEVSVLGPDVRATTTREGAFTLRGVPAGEQKLLVSHPGGDSKMVEVNVVPGANGPITVRLGGDIVKMGQFVVASAPEGMAQAVALQKVSVQLKLVAANDQFGEISEGNVGEYLKFLPGISIDYNVNDARGVSLRGLSTSFTIVAVDGTLMAGGSSTDDTRRFEFEQIAMNNVETTELYKSITPDLPASATGGFVNFVTKSAFDTEAATRVSYNVTFSAPSTNFGFSRQSGVWGQQQQLTIRPSLELNFARRVNEKFGFNLNYRLSEKYDDSPRTEITWVTAGTAPTVMTAPRLQQYNIRLEQKLTHREAFATKFDYRFTPKTKLMVAGQWNWYDLPFTQRGPSFVLGTASTANGEHYTSGTGQAINNGVLQRQKFGTTWHFNSTFSHEWNESRVVLTPYWSRADSKYRDTQYGFISAVASLPSTAYTSFTMSGVRSQRLPDISVFNGATPVPIDTLRNLANYQFTNAANGTNFQSRPWTAIDYKRGIGGSYSYDLAALRVPLKLQTGFAIDDFERSIARPDFRGAIATATGSGVTALRDPGFTEDVAFGWGTIQPLDPHKVWSAYSGSLTTVSADLMRRYDERNTAGYFRADAGLTKDILLVGGARWEKRKIDAEAQNRTAARSVAARVGLDYDEWYPSLSFKYTPLRQLVVRGGASRTVGHPDYIDLLPTITTESLAGGDGTMSVPDPHLKPYFVKNYDLSADYFLPNAGVLGFSAFRKDVANFITQRAMTAADINSIAREYGYNPAQFASGTVATNGGSSRLQGIELSYTQQFRFLPEPFRGLSLQLNGTYVDIDATDINTLYSQLRAVSPKTYNVVLGYRYRKMSFTSTTNWVDDSLYGGFVNTNYFVGTANANPALDTRLALYKGDKVTTDMKLEYAWTQRCSVYFLVRNVFNSARKEYMKGYLPQYQNVVLPYRYFEFGEPHLTLGVRGSF